MAVPDPGGNPSEQSFYYALAQTGLEMVAPIGVGLLLDHYLGWSPWGVIGGAVFGFVGGLGHMISMLNRRNKQPPDESNRDEP